MVHQITGKSLIAFGTMLVASTIIAAFLFDSLMVDFLALVVILLGFKVRDGSRGAAKWAIGFMAYYLLAALVLAGASFLAPEMIRLSGRPMSPDMTPWVVLPAAAFFGCWALLNLVRLVRFVRGTSAA